MFARPSLRIFLALALLLFIAPALVILGLYLYVAPNLPNVAELRDLRLTTPLQVFTQDGKLIAEFGDERRIPVPYEAIPERLVQAFIAVEDQRFFKHGGVDMMGLARIAVANLANDRAEGASTITMQVARNYYLSRERTLTRKITEIFLAMRIESHFDKASIMAMYLNKIHFSHRAYGIAAAAQAYYGKELAQLELHEMAMLAGLPKGESRYNPISNPTRALERRSHVLKRMLDENYISRAEFEEANARPVKTTYHGPRIEFTAPYLAEMVRAHMVEQYGEAAYSDGYKVTTTATALSQRAANQAMLLALREYDGRHGWRGAEARFTAKDLKNRASLLVQLARTPRLAELEPVAVIEVYEKEFTVLRSDGSSVSVPWDGMVWARKYISEDRIGFTPKTAADIVAVGDRVRIEKDSKLGWKLAQVPAVAGAFVALDPQTGGVLALAGGLDFDISQFNRVIQARRQPGSNLKPLIYAAAFESGMGPGTLVNDGPIVDQDNGDDDAWRPENESGKYLGPIRLRTALTRSTNSVSIRLFQTLGAERTIAFLKRFGFPEAQLPPYPSLALGAPELSPMEIVRAYAALANQGFLVEPYFIERITGNNEQIVYEHGAPTFCLECAVDAPAPAGQLTRVLDARTAFLITDVMKDVIHRGTATTTLVAGNSALLKRTDLAGKTGTTNESRDAWFSGFNPKVAATAWVGFDDHRKPLGRIEYGGKAALPIWMRYMETVLANTPVEDDNVPDGVLSARIDPQTGERVGENAANAMYEWFNRDHLPAMNAQQANASNGEQTDETGLF